MKQLNTMEKYSYESAIVAAKVTNNHQLMERLKIFHSFPEEKQEELMEKFDSMSQ